MGSSILTKMWASAGMSNTAGSSPMVHRGGSSSMLVGAKSSPFVWFWSTTNAGAPASSSCMQNTLLGAASQQPTMIQAKQQRAMSKHSVPIPVWLHSRH